MGGTILLIRHFRDQDNLFYLNDSPVIETELSKARTAAAEILSNLKKFNFNRIHIIGSNKKRSENTARELAKEVGNTIPVTIKIDRRIREIDQGSYTLPPSYKPGDYYPPLQDAWGAFFEETFKQGNLWYRFGDPVKTGNGRYKYPKLATHFTKLGENQIEFSIRFYSFVIDLYQKYGYNKKVLPVIVTHQALTHRFAELGKIAENIKSGSITKVANGRLPFLEWDQLKKIDRSRSASVEFGGVTLFPLSNLSSLVGILNPEVRYLKRLLVGRE